MRIVRGYNKTKLQEIAANCGSKTVKSTISYLDAPFIKGAKCFYVEIIDDIAFFAGNITKTHFRLYEMAVKEEGQKKGYGRIMVLRMKKLCQKHNIPKITCRTSKEETAIDFYRKIGGVIVGEKENDYEVEIKA